jgi:hypothetical protein
VIRRGERGQAGGMEVLPFGLLIFVGGALLLVNIWGVVDTKFAADAAAREAARWVVESAGLGTTPEADHGKRRPVEVTVSPADAAFVRCERISVVVETSVPAIRLPFLGGYGTPFEVRATHAELVDPTRSGVDGEATCIQ